MFLSPLEWCKKNDINWKNPDERRAAEEQYEKYFYSLFTVDELTILRGKFERIFFDAPGFNSYKNASGLYTDIGTLAYWEGFLESELYIRYSK